MKPIEVIYQLRGDEFLSRFARAFATEAAARHFCANLANFPALTIHYAITHEDGRTLHDTRRDGLIN